MRLVRTLQRRVRSKVEQLRGRDVAGDQLRAVQVGGDRAMQSRVRIISTKCWQTDAVHGQASR